MNKDFDKWNAKKKGLDAAAHQPPLISEGDLWWCANGENDQDFKNIKEAYICLFRDVPPLREVAG